MNLIEQLGGYECAAYEYKNTLLADDFPYVIKATGTKFTRPELGGELLEHRRQHKFYEVGDKVFCEHFEMDEVKNILTVEIVRGHYLQLSDGVSCTAHLVRHATDEEIKAGKRLEVKSDNGI